MLYFQLAKDVYLVRGSKRHCLYDLERGDLYNVGENVRKLILKLTQKQNSFNALTPNEKKNAESLIAHGLMIPSNEKKSLPDIRSLKIADYKIDFAWIEVTKQCNLKCSFCYEEASPTRFEQMSFTDFKHVINELHNIGVNQIQFIGGEPLLLKNSLKKMIELAKKYCTFIEVFSNGTLINDEWCKFFKKHKISVALSIHSYVAKNHDKITNSKGSYDKTNNAVCLLNRYKIPYRVAAVRTKSCSIGEEPKNSLYKIRADNMRLIGRGQFSQYSYKMFQEKAITKDKMRGKLNKNSIIMNVNGHNCFIRNLYISTKLDVFPCVMERRFKHGNIKKKNFKTTLKKNIFLLSKDKINGCKDCEYRYACFDCRPDSLDKNRYAQPWYCAYDPYVGKWQDLKIKFQRLL